MPASTESLRVDEEAHAVAPDFTPSSLAFTKLVALIPDENKFSFSTTAGLAIEIEVKMKQCLEPETSCYMLVTGVADDMVEAIHQELRGLGIRDRTRFTYEQTMQSLIVRLMPGGLHEVVRSSLDVEIWENVVGILGHPHLYLSNYGLNTFYSAPGRSKEGDNGFRALETRADGDGWPSLMIEVGYPGGLPALRCDAQWWLQNTRGRTRMVIIAEIAKNPNSLRLECWEMIAHPNSSATRDTGPWRPDRSQYFDIDGAGTVSPAGHDLVIPYRTLFDTSRLGVPHVIISAETLSEWALDVYDDFQRS